MSHTPTPLHRPRTLTFAFHHTSVAMEVKFQDHMGVWHDFETVPHSGAALDTAKEQLAYVEVFRALGYGVDVRQHLQ